MNGENKQTVSHVLLEVLRDYGKIDTIFGYPGGAILPLYDALPSYEESMTHILAVTEQGAGFMAQGYARSTGRIGVCFVTSGPGLTNAITPIADAYKDGVPLLIISGQTPTTMIGKDAFQEVNATAMTQHVTKYAKCLTHEDDIVMEISKAIDIALAGKKGPVHIDIPKDILGKRYEFSPPHLLFQEREQYFQAPLSCRRGDGGEVVRYEINVDNGKKISEVYELLKQSKKPILLIGQGVKYAHAEEILKQCVKILGIPTVSTALAKGILEDGDTYYLGMLGMHGFYHANQAMHEADFILNIGSRFDDRIVGTYESFGKNAKIVHVDINAGILNTLVKTDISIACDAKIFLESFMQVCDQKLEIESWRQNIKFWKESVQKQEKSHFFGARKVLQHIQKVIGKQKMSQTIFGVDVGQHQMFASQELNICDAKNWLFSGGLGTMGFSLPASIGASFANPHKQVVSISGDGGIQMNIQELLLLKQHNLNVKVVILNNGYLGMVKQWQKSFYDDNRSHVKIATPYFVALAKAYGIEKAYRVTNTQEMEQYTQDVFSCDGPALIEYIIEPEDDVYPMVPPGKSLGEVVC